MKSYYVDLDTVIDENFKEFKDYLRKNNIHYSIINESGPAGGWPIVRYRSASKNSLKQMINLHWLDEDLFDNIKEEKQ